jgi:plastocyanin
MADGGVAKNDADDTGRNPNGTTHTEFNLPAVFPAGQSQTCGTVVEPCIFDGSSVVSSGAPLAGPIDGFTVKITANPGTYIFHCRIHPKMVGSLTVVAAGAPATTPEQAAAASAAQASQLVKAGRAAEAAANKTAVKKNPNGTRTITMQAGTSTRDGRVAVLEFLPQHITIKKGDTVVWRPLDVNEPHTVTFPKDINTDMVPLCEGSGGRDTPAKPGHIPPQGPTDFTCPGGAPPELEFGGGNGVTTIKSKTTVSDSGLVGYRTVSAGFGLPSSALRTSWFVRFTGAKAGTYTYVCQIHDGMTGTIRVTG